MLRRGVPYQANFPIVVRFSSSLTILPLFVTIEWISINVIVPTDVSNKWKHLKEKYIRKRKAFCKVPASGSATNEVALPKWNLFEHMRF